ncbi:hypothetical protein KAFR_0F00890 [Kazachstania africana CBS 2517]|uniref:Mediator of RNA polymerase II transcription subunit 9 n=1 Tax=Kazachstania africana (strain ATCC 22294 / BCRC 22015 / CBS 2517 / CECT 1963 / NBRC 1671 / NRRL Y-8276) TaxID=1071382 RepID=H2AWD6_KAZAF|nr:hypothetical protein KAFR_0F00890 [Kazachstania africana CBS 2517]CCF58686.1 hypothetical protein KAFR_0F00890 [Kazachstania africana CBS 2517]
MSLSNPDLQAIRDALLPQKVDQSSKTNITGNVATQSTTGEFIPHIFYSLHNIMKNPNQSLNQMENATGFIKHRLKNSKSLIQNNEQLINLLSYDIDYWENYLQNKENEAQIKKNLFAKLSERINNVLEDNGYEREDSPESENDDSAIPRDSTDNDIEISF